MKKGRKSCFIVILVLILLPICALLAIQLVPYGRDQSNPPVTGEPQWDSAETRALAKTACFDCHSNETVWPWYTNVAPASWLVMRDVEKGRSKLNFSEWGSGRQPDRDEIIEVILESQMPPPQYTLIHSEARLSQAQREQFAAGMEKTLAGK